MSSSTPPFDASSASFNAATFTLALDYLLGEKRRERMSNAQPRLAFPIPTRPSESLMLEQATESCLFKSGMACVLGFGLGGLFGMFTASVDPSYTLPGGVPGQPPPTMTVRGVLKEMGQRSMSYGKNFAV